MNDFSTSWEDKCCCCPANREEQQRRGYSGTPEDSPAEGKAILRLRHKSTDELQGQLKQLPHRRSMPALHKASLLMCPCMLRGKAWQMCEAQNKRRKSSIHALKRQRLQTWRFSFSVLCFCRVFFSENESENEVFKKKHAWCLLSATCHLRSYQQSENSPRWSLTCLRQTMKGNRLAKNSSVCQSHSWDVMHSPTHACIVHWRLIHNPQPSSCLDSKITFFQMTQ